MSGNPPDKWEAVKLADSSSGAILAALNGQEYEVTAAFVQQCSDGLYLFLGFYGTKE